VPVNFSVTVWPKRRSPLREQRGLRYGSNRSAGYDTFRALSSTTKEVCSEESSLPVNFSVMVWPMYEATL
jgi:hypothetical protein